MLETVSVAALVVVALATMVWVLQRLAHAVKVHRWRRGGNDYSSSEYVPEHLGCRYNQAQLDEGRQFLKQSKVVVCGLVRDKVQRIPMMTENVARMTNQFLDYRVLVVENDSTDGTRDGLLAWAKDDPKVQVLGCGVNAPECKMKLAKTVAHSTYTPRIGKMALLRNEYIKHMRADPSLQDFDFAIVVDLDLEAYLFVDGLWHTGYLFKKHGNWDAVCSNGLQVEQGYFDDYTSYLDSYALRTEEVWSMRKRALDNMSVINWPLRCTVSPRKLVSGFSGLTMYRFKSLVKCDYHLLHDNFSEALCEHVSVSLQMNEVWINPAFMYIIVNNDL